MEKSNLFQNQPFVEQHKKTLLIINRLSRIEGHVQAVKRMLKEGKPCPDVLIQLAAVKSAVQKAAQVVMADHIESCFGQAAVSGASEEQWHRLKAALDKYIG